MLTAEELKSVLHYDPDTGLFTWIIKKAIGTAAGKVAGSRTIYGYIKIKINYRFYQAHRLAWIYMTGEWPERELDHRNNDGTDNKWGNLRAATPTQNQGNKRLAKNNTSGVKGVHWDGNKWQARICGRLIGRFENKEDAAAAYAKKAKEVFGEFARSA